MQAPSFDLLQSAQHDRHAKHNGAQGRTDEAEKLVKSSLDILKRCGVSTEAQIFSDALITSGDVLTIKRDFKEAVNRFEMAAKGVGNRWLSGIMSPNGE